MYENVSSSLFLGKFTAETDVWSFGVTLWEIFTFAKEAPYDDMDDEKVIALVRDLLQKPNRNFPYLSQPEGCPDKIYEVMKTCWITLPSERPDFACLFEHLTDICGTSGK